MTKKLFIAEKPDMARAYVDFLWPDGGYEKTKHYYRKGDVTVTSAFGHVLTLGNPEDYGEEYKAWSSNIFPKKWIVYPLKATVERVNAIKELLKETDVVVHGGDPDREGQLLIDEILVYLHYTGQVQRLLVNAKDDVSMKRAFDSIVDNDQFKNDYYAGLARQRADWLVGMNLTRAYTVNSRKFGFIYPIHIGRVQTPTLALVVNREKEIQNFKTAKYYVLTGLFEKDGIEFRAKFSPTDRLPQDSEGRIIDKSLLEAVAAKLSQAAVRVKDCKVTKCTEQPPLPYSLDTLQVIADRKLSLSPEDTLNVVQSLYEKKFVSYPRCDCEYIPESQHGDATRILSILRDANIVGAAAANPHIKSNAFNDKKTTAHHALIPTGVKPSGLNKDEEAVYRLIAERYVLQFYKPFVYDKVTFSLAAADETFNGSGRKPIDVGFTVLFKKEDDNDADEDSLLPIFNSGDNVKKKHYDILAKETRPPKRFTRGSLVEAMKNIWRFMDKSNPKRDLLKDGKGIGTNATRAEIIKKLMTASSKNNAAPCMKLVKKELRPTPFGVSVIENIDLSLTKADATAEMEYNLSLISEGKKPLGSYMDDITSMVNENIQYASSHKFKLPSDAPICPVCGKSELQRHFSAKTNKAFWVCANPDCHGQDGKTMYYEDDNGKPLIVKCPVCKIPLKYIPQGKFGPFWSCPECRKIYSDHNHKPVFNKITKK